MKTGFHYDMPEATYHNDPCEVPSLSSSVAGILDRQSAAHAYAFHPRLGGKKREPTKALDMGAIAHRLLLGTGADILSVTADDWRTKAAQQVRDEARASGKIPVLAKDHERAFDASQVLRGRFADLGIVLDGQSEVTLFWDEKSSHGPVQCRGRIDHVAPGGGVLYDLKSCRSAHPEACQKHIHSYGYSIQQAAYVRAVERIRHDLAGRVDFTFVFFELESPHVVTPVHLSGEFAALGVRSWERAIEIWGRCLKSNKWPGYVTGTIEIAPPDWALMRQIARDSEEADSA